MPRASVERSASSDQKKPRISEAAAKRSAAIKEKRKADLLLKEVRENQPRIKKGACLSKDTYLKASGADLGRSASNAEPKPDQASSAWMSRDDHSCAAMYNYLQNSRDLESPHSVAAVWRILNCRRCGFKFHARVAASPSLAPWYLRFGADLKLVHSRKPKLLIRDLESIRLAQTASRILSDPRFKPGWASSAADNAWLWENLGEAAGLAGMLNSAFVSLDSEDPITAKLMEQYAVSCLPYKQDWDQERDKGWRTKLNLAAHWYYACKGFETRQEGEDLETLNKRLEGNLAIVAYHTFSQIGQWLMCFPPKTPVEKITKGVKVFRQEDLFRTHLLHKVRIYLNDLQEKYPEKEIVLLEEEKFFIPGDLCYYEEEGKILVMNIGLAIQRGYQPHISASEISLRAKTFGPDWLQRKMDGMEMRTFLMQKVLEKYLRSLPESSANCDFVETWPLKTLCGADR